ncbi:uncharacterized protein LOC143446950 [Clavelina lepadiformis]|uniref:uncharacterized protein LOC143446950 n=1 Tax=Clavelina lepadiformis TaxID=159417 RepID=UPI0040433A24
MFNICWLLLFGSGFNCAWAGLESSGFLFDEEDLDSNNMIRQALLETSSCPRDVECPSDVQDCTMYRGFPYCYVYQPNQDETCMNQPCQNFGTCRGVYPSSYRCDCPPNVIGYNCETAYIMCTTTTCQNGGTCITVGGGGARCQCADGYSGAFCQDDPSCPLNCLNGGTCSFEDVDGVIVVLDSWQRTPRCNCMPGYTGQTCETLAACHSLPCLNGATCQDEGLGFKCLCAQGYMGFLCEERQVIPSLPCDSNPCLNNGLCINYPTDTNLPYRCLCAQGYTGDRCEERQVISSLPCDSNPCLNNGLCVNYPTGTNLAYKCFCTQDYTGNRCQDGEVIPPLPCDSNPCLNNGRCINYPTDTNSPYSCVCPSGYSGYNCLTRVSGPLACASNPCVGEGCSCVESCRHEFGYYCVSNRGYVGKRCDVGPPNIRCRPNEIEIDISQRFYQEFRGRSRSNQIFVTTSLSDYERTRSRQCEAELVNGRYQIILQEPFVDCETKRGRRSGSGDLAYNNTIWINTDTGNPLYDMPRPLLDFSCSFNYSLDIVTSIQPVIDMTRPKLHSETRYKLAVNLCKVSVCQLDGCPDNYVINEGAIYTVSNRVHLSINVIPNLLFSATGSVHIGVEKAFLSCSNSRDVSSNNLILVERCSNFAPLSVSVGQSRRNKACLSFIVPRMLRCNRVFIHLRVSLCGLAEQTTQVCNDGSTYKSCPTRTKRHVTNNVTSEQSYHVIGPLMFVEYVAGKNTIEFKKDNGEKVVVTGGEAPNLKPVRNNSSEPSKLFTGLLSAASAILVLFLFVSVFTFFSRRQQVKEQYILSTS